MAHIHIKEKESVSINIRAKTRQRDLIDQAAEKLKSLGARISNSVSKQTTALIAGSDPGSKFEKATKLKVPILDEDDLNQLLRDSQ